MQRSIFLQKNASKEALFKKRNDSIEKTDTIRLINLVAGEREKFTRRAFRVADDYITRENSIFRRGEACNFTV